MSIVTWNRHHETVPQILDCSNWEVWTRNSTWVFLAPVNSSRWRSLYRFPDMPTCDNCSQRRVERHMVYQIIFFTKHSWHQGTSYQSIRQNWEGRKYKLLAWLRIYTYNNIFDWERGEGVLAITKKVKVPFTGQILYGNLERKETPLKSGGEALLNLCYIQTVVLSNLWREFFFYWRDTQGVHKLCLPPTWGTEQSSGCHVKPNNN